MSDTPYGKSFAKLDIPVTSNDLKQIFSSLRNWYERDLEASDHPIVVKMRRDAEALSSKPNFLKRSK